MQSVREHLDSVNESYFQHLTHASAFGFKLIWAGFACLLHGLIPSWFCTTGSKAIIELHDKMVVNRAKSPSHCED